MPPIIFKLSGFNLDESVIYRATHGARQDRGRVEEKVTDPDSPAHVRRRMIEDPAPSSAVSELWRLDKRSLHQTTCLQHRTKERQLGLETVCTPPGELRFRVLGTPEITWIVVSPSLAQAVFPLSDLKQG